LWAVVDQRLTQKQDTRLHELIALGKQGQLTADEQAEMESLIDLVDHQMLLRSEALLLLQQRGHDIDTYLNPKQN
jgi:predicted NUDIX family phosphoesterase